MGGITSPPFRPRFAPSWKFTISRYDKQDVRLPDINMKQSNLVRFFMMLRIID
jgi:hypothetical protein